MYGYLVVVQLVGFAVGQQHLQRAVGRVARLFHVVGARVFNVHLVGAFDQLVHVQGDAVFAFDLAFDKVHRCHDAGVTRGRLWLGSLDRRGFDGLVVGLF